MTIRPMIQNDLPAVKAVIDTSDLFPSEMLDDMAAQALAGTAPTERWLVIGESTPMGVAYFAPERMTDGTWNLYLIAIHADHQGQSHGAKLLRHVEETLSAEGQRILLVETSGDPSFERTRQFYRTNGYDQEAVIRAFYGPGDDKVIFRKAL